MKILVAGSSGLIGTALAERLRGDGHKVVRLVRRAPSRNDEVRWDPVAGSIDTAKLAGVDAAIHLGGASITARRWNAAYKAEIRDSRVNSARLLSETLAQLEPSPSVFVCASALGYYGDRADETLTENSPKGDGFMAEVTAEWEAATAAAMHAGIRMCNMRIGVALSATGDLPKNMLLPFKLGLGGKIGSGRQYMSWIHIDDVVGAFVHTIDTPTLQGAINLAAPNPVTNTEFTQALARVLSRPALFTVPSFALQIAMGEVAQVVTASTRMNPQRLLASGYTFRWQTIEPALRDILS